MAFDIYRVKILGIIPGMQTTISKYAEDNNLKFHPMKYLMAGGQIISRGFKEKLLSVFKGRYWVSQITIEEKSIRRRKG